MTETQDLTDAEGDYQNSGSIQSLKVHQRTAQNCPNCGALAYSYKDNHRGEKICIACGFVTDPQTMDASRIKHEKPPLQATRENKGKVLVGKEEYQFLTCKQKYQHIFSLQQRYDRDTEGEMNNHRYREYDAFADVCKTNFGMTSGQLTQVKTVLGYFKMNGGLKLLHSRASRDRIILAICILMMWRDGRCIDIPSDVYCQDIGLSKREYNTIIGNYMNYDSEISKYGMKEAEYE